MPSILIVQNYNANKGDSSVVHAMRQTLLEVRPALDIRLTSYDPNQAEREYHLPAADTLVCLRRMKMSHSVLGFLRHAVVEGCWMGYSALVVLAARFGRHLWVPARRRRTIDFYLAADVVVLPGGHFFTSLNSIPCNVAHFWAMLFAVLLGKRTMIYAQTIGPFFGIGSRVTWWMTRFLLKRVDLVTTRETDCLRFCQGLDNVFLTGEAVFALKAPQAAHVSDQIEHLKESGRVVVGATIHHLYFKHFFSRADYVARMAEIFDRIVTRYDAELLLIPMENAMHEGGDRPIGHEIQAAMRHPGRFHLLQGEHDAMATAAAIAGVDVFIGTKTHSIVYSLKAGVPTLALAYQQKSNEFMEMFGVRENAVDLRDLDPGRVMAVFDKLMQARARLRTRQCSRLEMVRQKALENNRLLLSLLSLPEEKAA